MEPLSSSPLALSICSVGVGLGGDGLLDVGVELVFGLLLGFERPFGHAVVLGDQVDEDAEVGQHDDEDDPQDLRPPEVSWRRKMSAEDDEQSQSQTTKPKKISIVQKTSRNG